MHLNFFYYIQHFIINFELNLANIPINIFPLQVVDR